MTGRKDDTGKLPMALIPSALLRGVATVLAFGAERYGADNWRDVPNAKRRYYDALQRHLVVWRSGELCDADSKLPHLWHAATNVAFLISFQDGHDPKAEEL